MAMAISGRPATLEEASRPWLATFEGLVVRGARSPSTLDQYRYVVARGDAVAGRVRPVISRIGSSRLGEVTTPRLDRFGYTVGPSRLGCRQAKLQEPLGETTSPRWPGSCSPRASAR